MIITRGIFFLSFKLKHVVTIVASEIIPKTKPFNTTTKKQLHPIDFIQNCSWANLKFKTKLKYFLRENNIHIREIILWNKWCYLIIVVDVSRSILLTNSLNWFVCVFIFDSYAIIWPCRPIKLFIVHRSNYFIIDKIRFSYQINLQLKCDGLSFFSLALLVSCDKFFWNKWQMIHTNRGFHQKFREKLIKSGECEQPCGRLKISE